MRGRVLMMVLLAVCHVPSVARGDGGTIRCSEQRGSRRITVFTAPSVLHAGLADVSVLVQNSDTGKPLLDVPIVVAAYPLHEPWRKISVPATTEAATNKLLRAGQLQLAEPGRWHVEVVVQESDQGPPIGFDVEVAPAPPPWLDMSLWIGWPLLVIVLFVVHQCLVHRRQSCSGDLRSTDE